MGKMVIHTLSCFLMHASLQAPPLRPRTVFQK